MERTPQRLLALDAFRGATMLLMASSGFGLAQVARAYPESPVWRIVGEQVEHSAWTGCTLWDIIQPAFMFMVGVALPWSIASRTARGQSFSTMLGHALWRSLILVLLAVFLTSAWSKSTDWVFTNVLAQIGLGYPFLFLLAFAKVRTQWLAALGLLFLYWLLFALYPLPPANFDWASVGVPANWPHLTGFAAHWEKNANFAAGFDRWFLNLFPRETPFTFNRGGYQTLNFVPSLATMLFGLLAGQLFRGPGSVSAKVQRLLLLGSVGVILGTAFAMAGVCPVVKRIWTPSWAVFSGGLVMLLLAVFVTMIEWWRWRAWTFPLVVVGLNPIALYCMWQLLPSFVRENLKRHLGAHLFERLGPTCVPVLESGLVLLTFWLVLWWMHRRKIYLRI